MKHFSAAAILCIAAANFIATAESYTIKKLNTPTVRINNTDMKVGDTFHDGAVIEWSSPHQAMRVLTGSNEPITIKAAASPYAAKSRTVISGMVRMSQRAVCTSLADHRQAFEGTDGKGHYLLDTITVASQWLQNTDNYFRARLQSEDGEQLINLPYNANGEAIISRDMFPAAIAHPSIEMDIELSIEYYNGRKGESRTIAPKVILHVLPAFLEE